MILPPLWRSLLRTRLKQNRSQNCVLREFSGRFLPDPSHDRRNPGSTCAPAPELSRLPLPPFPFAAGLSTPAPRPPLRLPAAPPAPAPPRPARRTFQGAHLLEGRRHLRGTGGDPRPAGSSAGGRRGAPARRRAASPAAGSAGAAVLAWLRAEPAAQLGALRPSHARGRGAARRMVRGGGGGSGSGSCALGGGGGGERSSAEPRGRRERGSSARHRHWPGAAAGAGRAAEGGTEGQGGALLLSGTGGGGPRGWSLAEVGKPVG